MNNYNIKILKRAFEISLVLMTLIENIYSQNANDSFETITKIIVSDTSKEFITYQKNKNKLDPWITSFQFNVPRDMDIKFSIYDLNSNLIRELLNQKLKSGNYEIEWKKMQNLKSGLYFYKFESEDTIYFKKMVLIK